MMHEHARKRILVALFIVAISLAYLFSVLVQYIRDGRYGEALSLGGACQEPHYNAGGKTNPNKALFISCGGFLE